MKNVILENVTIENTVNNPNQRSNTGGIAGQSMGKIMNCGIDSGTISAIKTLENSNSSVWNIINIGGIVGGNYNEINGCYNKASLGGNHVAKVYNSVWIGGISGQDTSSKIINCYNHGNINSIGGYEPATGGIARGGNNITINNSYNIGVITNSSFVGWQAYCGGIMGRNGDSSAGTGSITNSYCTTAMPYSYYGWNGTKLVTSTGGRIDANTLKGYATNLGTVNFVADQTNINYGYPILKWQAQYVYNIK